MTTPADQRAESPSGSSGWVRRIDDGVFAVEQAIVAFALSTITVVIFIDVVARRIDARDSKVGALLSKIAGITDRETQVYVDTEIAPWVTLGLALFFVGFGVYAARRFARGRAGAPTASADPKAGFRDPAKETLAAEPPALGREIGIAAGTAAAVVAGGWALAQAFAALESKMVYAVFFGATALAYSGYAMWKKPDRWQARAATAWACGGALVWVALSFVPEGYTWSKQVALMLLLWVGMLSASICVHEGKHIRMEATAKLVPPKLRPYVSATGMLVAAGFCALMAYLGFLYLVGPRASDDEYLPEIMTLFGTRYIGVRIRRRRTTSIPIITISCSTRTTTARRIR